MDLACRLSKHQLPLSKQRLFINSQILTQLKILWMKDIKEQLDIISSKENINYPVCRFKRMKRRKTNYTEVAFSLFFFNAFEKDLYIEEYTAKLKFDFV